MNHPHPHRPAHTIWRLFIACLIGAATLFLSACATTDTGDTATPQRQYFFSPSDGTWFGTSMTWTEDAIRETAAKAENGDAAAQYEMALILLDDGQKKDSHNEKAFDLMKKSAEQGNANAEVYLGTMYRNGQGVKKDREEAIRRYNMAIAKGSAWGMFEMGSLLYERPKEIPQRPWNGLKKPQTLVIPWHRLPMAFSCWKEKSCQRMLSMASGT